MYSFPFPNFRCSQQFDFQLHCAVSSSFQFSVTLRSFIIISIFSYIVQFHHHFNFQLHCAVSSSFQFSVTLHSFIIISIFSYIAQFHHHFNFQLHCAVSSSFQFSVTLRFHHHFNSCLVLRVLFVVWIITLTCSFILLSVIIIYVINIPLQLLF